MSDLEVGVEYLLAAGVVTRSLIIIITEVILFIHWSRGVGRTSCTPVVAIAGSLSFVLPVRHLSQSRSVRVALEMY